MTDPGSRTGRGAGPAAVRLPWYCSWKFWLAVVPAVALVALLAFGFTRDPRRIDSPLVGKPAADFTLELLDGGVLRLSALRGRPVVVNFWASWCYPACWNEAPRLEAAWRRYRDRGLMMVGIVYQDSAANARDFVREHGKSYPNGLDPGGRIAIEYGVYGVPETFFIDREGIIVYKHVGEIQAETLTARIEGLLGAPQARAGRPPAPAGRP